MTQGNALYPSPDQGDVVMHCRLAADSRAPPKWTARNGAVNPLNNEVYMTMTNNSQRDGSKIPLDAANPRSNTNGHIIRWKEEGGQAAPSSSGMCTCSARAWTANRAKTSRA